MLTRIYSNDMSSLLEQISQDLNSAIKARDAVAVSTLRFLLSGLHNAKIAKGKDLTDDEVISEIAKGVKRHQESIVAYEAGGRVDLAEKEKTEMAILRKYQPAQLPAQEIEKIVDEVIAQFGAVGIGDLSKVMAAVMPKVKGKADGAVVSEIVKSRLSTNG